MLYGKVDYVITDCPILMGVFYDKKYNGLDTVDQAVNLFLKETSNVQRLNFFANRCKEFDPAGRFCSAESALLTDDELRAFLYSKEVPYTTLRGSIDEQVKYVIDILLAD
jgi:hypothetical protein